MFLTLIFVFSLFAFACWFSRVEDFISHNRLFKGMVYMSSTKYKPFSNPDYRFYDRNTQDMMTMIMMMKTLSRREKKKEAPE